MCDVMVKTDGEHHKPTPRQASCLTVLPLVILLPVGQHLEVSPLCSEGWRMELCAARRSPEECGANRRGRPCNWTRRTRTDPQEERLSPQTPGGKKGRVSAGPGIPERLLIQEDLLIFRKKENYRGKGRREKKLSFYATVRSLSGRKSHNK